MDDSAALGALFDSDRRCRSAGATARDHWRRARALKALGFPRAGAADLLQAERMGLRDPDVLRWFVERHPDPTRRAASARVALADARIGEELRGVCIAALLDSGAPLVGHAVRRGGTVVGWLAWRGSGLPAADVITDDPSDPRPAFGLADADTNAEGSRRASFSFPAAPTASAVIRPSLGGVACAPLAVYAASATSPVPAASRAAPVALTVIVPVFGDAPSLAACLAALRAERAGDVGCVLVDDASPDPAISAIAERFAREEGGTYLRRPVNGGFAAAVNAGLALCPASDALILNSDVVLPPGALRRLRAAAARDPDIGTLSPLSNDRGCASFPVPLRGGAALPAAEALAVDAAAAQANAGRIVDVPVPLGSCFYATRRCLDRVGGLSLAYGRGYYEDVEFHLRAGEAGLRRVVACDVYVSHLGGRSFGADRQALIERNRSILHRRFPDYRAADALFDRADPLHRLRAAIEGCLPPPGGPAVLIVARARGAGTLISDRERSWRGRGRGVLVLRWTARACVIIVACAVADGDGPRSLDFALDDDAPRFLAYLARVGRGRIELLEPERIPGRLLALLEGTGRALHAVVDSLASAAAVRDAAEEVSDPAAAGLDARCRPAPGRGRGWTVVARDRVAAAHLGIAPPARCPPGPSPEIGGRMLGAAMLGVLLPEACPRAELLVLSLARTLRRLRRTTRVVVLGQPSAPALLLAPGNLWVSGPLGGDDPAEVLAHHAVDRLVSPYRGALFWHLDEVAARSGRAKAYFDWSDGRLPADPGDLALPPSLDDEAAAARLAHWCAGTPSPRESASG